MTNQTTDACADPTRCTARLHAPWLRRPTGRGARVPRAASSGQPELGPAADALHCREASERATHSIRFESRRSNARRGATVTAQYFAEAGPVPWKSRHRPRPHTRIRPFSPTPPPANPATHTRPPPPPASPSIHPLRRGIDRSIERALEPAEHED